MRCVAVLLCTLLGVGIAAPAAAGDPAVVVIVHPDRAAEALTRDQLRAIYLKQRRFWNDGAPIVALNREPDSIERDRFTRLVLGTSSPDLNAYWNERYFDGIFPPPTLSSGSAMKRYVATDRNAIGYIDAGELDATVHALLRLE